MQENEEGDFHYYDPVLSIFEHEIQLRAYDTDLGTTIDDAQKLDDFNNPDQYYQYISAKIKIPAGYEEVMDMVRKQRTRTMQEIYGGQKYQPTA